MRRWTGDRLWGIGLAALAVALLLAGPARGQQAPSASGAAKGEPVVRTFGDRGGYHTEVTSRTRGTLSDEDRRQVAVLTAQVFQHVHEARQAVEADEVDQARREIDKGKQALKAIRALLPTTAVKTRTEAADGKVIYEDEREVQEDRVPLFEGMMHTQTLAPIVEAKRGAATGDGGDVKGVGVVESETIRTEAVADLGVVEGQLRRAARALEGHKPSEAALALLTAQIRGVDFRYSKEDSPLAEARDAIWLARRSLEENNAEQARFNLNVARHRLRIYREVAPKDRQADVDQMLKEAAELEGRLHKETAQNPATGAERTSQGSTVTKWWDKINGWFRKHF